MPEANYQAKSSRLRTVSQQATAKLQARAESQTTADGLHEQNQWFHALSEHPTRFIVLLQPDGTLLVANQAAMSLWKVTAEVIGKPFWQAGGWFSAQKLEGRFHPPLSSKQLRKAIARAANGESVRSEIDVCVAGERLATLDCSIVPMKDEAGQVVLLTFEAHEISDQKLDAVYPSNSIEPNPSLFSLSTDLIAKHTLEGKFIYASPAYCRLLGGELQDLRELLLHDLMHPEDKQAFQRLCPISNLSAPYQLSYRMQTQKGYVRVATSFYAVCAPGTDTPQEVLAVSTLNECQDSASQGWQQVQALVFEGESGATELIQAKQCLKQETAARHYIEQMLIHEEQALAILKSIGDGVIITDMLGRVTYLNPAAERLTGWSAAQAKGRLSREVFRIVDEATRQPIEAPAEKALREDCTVEVPEGTLLLTQDGAERPISDSTAPVCNRNGQTLGTVIVFRDISQARQLAYQLSWQARHDSLTGLANRREFEHRVMEAIDDAKHENLQHIVCYLDLDQFKVINDTCGYVAGDELLRQIATLLKQRVRSTDVLVRLGGDEFGILLYRCPLPQAVQLADSLRQLIKDFRFVWEDQTYTVGVSIGLVEISAETADLTSVLSAADAACYGAKSKGRNRVHIYQADDRELAQHLGERQWVAKIHHALETDRFCLYCQSIAAIPSYPSAASIRHYEILLRLKDETGKLVLPMAFIPAAERYGLMPAIDRWVVRTFFANYQEICSLDLLSTPQCYYTYTINLSGASINDDRFLDYVKEQFRLYPIAPQRICFEITETVAIANLNKAIHFIRELKRLGCQFALDDFGSGMSSFAYLKNLPVDYLKIDGNFVKNIVDDRIDQVMVDCINRVGHAIGVQTIAEFVENQNILIKLRDLGVDYAQGYGIARPCPLCFDQLTMNNEQLTVDSEQ